MQDEDPIVAEVKAFVKKMKSLPRDFPGIWFQRNFRWLMVKDGILYRKSYADALDSFVLQAILPDAMVTRVFERYSWLGMVRPSGSKQDDAQGEKICRLAHAGPGHQEGDQELQDL